MHACTIISLVSLLRGDSAQSPLCIPCFLDVLGLQSGLEVCSDINITGTQGRQLLMKVIIIDKCNDKCQLY